jgi:hypothetical protein
MKKYTFELIIFEGNDEFWEELKNKSGCDEVTDEIKKALGDAGWYTGQDGDCKLTLKRFEEHEAY